MVASRSLSRWLLRGLCLAAVLSLAAKPVSGKAWPEFDIGKREGVATSLLIPLKARVVNVNSFGFRLLEELSDAVNASDGNVFLSPVSVSTALAMAGVGATKNSDSLSELKAAFGGMDLKGASEYANKLGRRWHPMARMMKEALGSQWNEGSGVDVSFANGGWYKASVLATYKNDMEVLFNATSAPLETGEKINEWVAGETHGRITDLVKPGELDAEAVLVSAIHFKGAWGTGFSKRKTRPMTFHSPSGPIDVNMMWRELPGPGECFAVGFPACVERDNTIHTRYALPGGGAPDVEVVEIGFGTSGDYSAVIMMPGTGSQEKDAAAAAEAHAAEVDMLVELLAQEPELWGNITSQADRKLKERNEALSKNYSPDGEVQILLPRFKVDFKSDLVKALRSLGIVTPFSQKEGEFLGISKEPEVYIEEVSHVASLEVNEEGAEAAAATAMILAPLSMSYPTVVIFDHPFLFFITNKKTGAILFAGRVNSPETLTK